MGQSGIKGSRIGEVNGLQPTIDYKLFLFLERLSETEEKQTEGSVDVGPCADLTEPNDCLQHGRYLLSSPALCSRLPISHIRILFLEGLNCPKI